MEPEQAVKATAWSYPMVTYMIAIYSLREVHTEKVVREIHTRY